MGRGGGDKHRVVHHGWQHAHDAYHIGHERTRPPPPDGAPPSSRVPRRIRSGDACEETQHRSR